MSIVSKLKTKLNPSLNPLYRILRTLNFRRCVTRAGFEKVKGAPSADMLECVINSGFVAENLHMMSTSSASALMPASKSSMYRFMSRDSHGSFQQLSMNVAYEAFRKIDDFSSKRERDRFAFVIDDSVLQFEKAKAMELCTWTFDHNE